jgi:GNAT superfamily N-acetyltransferase
MPAQPTLRLETVTGAALHAHQPALAVLRVAVFREWPYLYAGDDVFERKYLARYANTPGAAVVLALDGATIVGASTCLPLAAETANVRAPFEEAGWPVANVCYFGESVLLEPYRGQGIGVKFFAAREAHAASLGLDLCAFCSVIRPDDHPLRPADHVPLDEFWRHRGYTPRPDLVCTMRWQDVDRAVETDKQLSFWVKSLSGAPLP